MAWPRKGGGYAGKLMGGGNAFPWEEKNGRNGKYNIKHLGHSTRRK
jgi:hypothetical protein